MATTTLVKDPISGAFMSNANSAGTGRTMVDLNGGRVAPAQSTAAKTDAYTLFNRNIASILTQIQNSQTAGNAVLGGAKDYLTSESVAPNGPQSFAPGIFSGSQVTGQQQLQQSFAPAITSINTQMQNTGTALGNLKDSLGTMATVFQPKTVGPGESLTTPAGMVLMRPPNYQPAVFRADTGTYDSFDSANGYWRSEEEAGGGTGPAGGASGSPAGNPVVGGVNLSSYAADPGYSGKVKSIYDTLTATGTPTADSIDAYIKGHTGGKGAVTGQQIMQAAAHSGVDPNLLSAQLALETSFGTVGESPANNNPGGILWANQPNATQGTPRPSNEGGFYAKFKSPMDGLYAMAEIVARHKTDGTTGTQTGTAAVSPVGGTFSPEASAKIQQLPATFQNYVDAGPKGVAYINDGRVPQDANIQLGIKTAAARAGIPYLSGQEAENVKNIGIVYDSVKKLNDLVTGTLGSGFLGRVQGLTVNQMLQQAQVGQGPSIKQFEQYRSQAINNLKALTAGGTTFRITQTEIDTAVGNIPSSADNQETAHADLSTLISFMDTKLGATFPYTKGQVAAGPQEGETKQYQGRTYKVVNGAWALQ